MKLLNKLLPSSKLNQDIHIHYNKLDNIEPISLRELSLIKPIKNQLIKLYTNKKVHIERDNSKKLSLIIPYRKREEHLKEFIPFMHSYLQKQKIDYEIIIVTQDDEMPFNRAKLMNIGAKYSREESDYFIFHDVDLLPQNINYNFCNHTQRLFTYIEDNGSNKEYAQQIFGGVTLVPKKLFYEINGFSNNYWQWGKEDDDFLMRHLFKGLTPLVDTKGKLKALKHPKSLTRDNKGNYTENKKILHKNKKLYKKNKKLFSNFKRGLTEQEQDGINNIHNYTIIEETSINRIKTILVNFHTSKEKS